VPCGSSGPTCGPAPSSSLLVPLPAAAHGTASYYRPAEEHVSLWWGVTEWGFGVRVLAERRRRAGRQVHTTREPTDRIWPGFGRLDRFAFRALPSHPPGGGDAEQIQTGPQRTGGQVAQS
jgi:hypothetical protein